jgi:hypothetical protein
MDPFSITASAVTLIQAAGIVSRLDGNIAGKK